MGKIIVLDENTANKIAAGEVVERPASIVKELVENSIDSGATNISVDIKNGGVKYIRVTDNGSGIDADDALIAFERHATSKIKHADDLFSIVTLGFRGEALASIAAVSNVELTTRTNLSEIGTFIRISGGKLIEHTQIGCPVGTTIIVRDLFFNTPARYKFLKKDATEASYVVDLLSKIALARTDISFKLTGAFANRNEVFHTPGNNDLKSAIYNVFGREISQKTIDVDFESDGIRVTGIAGSSEISKPNRNSQIVFLNSRYIKSKIITASASEAYKTYLMKNKFPFLVLNLQMNPSTFDVNVHPAKLDVRFSNEGQIFSAIYHALTNALHSKQRIKEPLNNEVARVETTNKTDIKANIPSFEANKIVQQVGDLFQEVEKVNYVQQTFSPSNKVVFNEGDNTKENDNTNENQIADKKPSENQIEDRKTNNNDYNKKYEIENKKVNEINEIFDSVYVGQIFNTYLIFQQNEKLFLIDQHAAHERIKFEQIFENHLNSQMITQQLLIPKVINLSPADLAVFHENCEVFIKLGFEIEPFGGNSLAIRQVPSELEGNKIDEALFELLSRLSNSNKSTRLPDDELIYIIACKAAIKGNTKITESEANNLITQLVKMKNPLSCPHGRPTILKVERRDFEKLFKRIV